MFLFSPVSPECLFLTKYSQNCKMFYRRIVNLEEDEDDLMAAPMPPQPRQPPQFGKPSFGPAPPEDLQKKRRRNHDSESETEGTCNQCHRPKRSKRQGDKKRKAVDEAESESDEGDYRGLSRIALVSRRKRVKVSKKAFADFWATDINGMSFAAYVHKSPSVSGSQDQDRKKLFSSTPENGWKWPEKAAGGLSGLSPGVDSGISLGHPRDTSPRQSEESGSDDNDENPRYDTNGLDSTPTSPTRGLSAEENDRDNHVEGNKTTSPDPGKSKSERRGQGSDAYYRTPYGGEDEDEYVEVDDIIYVIPGKPKSKQHLDRRGQFGDTYRRSPVSSQSHESPRYAVKPRRPQNPRPSAAKRISPSPIKATEADAKKHRIPPGYSLRNWDPTEDPILLIGSVFDANSLGKWIYDWTVYTHGPATPISELAGDLWLLLIQLAGKIKRSKEAIPRIQPLENREMVEDFIESGERMTDKLRKLLKTCEQPMLRAAKKKEQLGRNSGIEFVETIFGRKRELEKTERFMQQMRLWNMRFDANCESVVRGRKSEAPSNELQSTA